MIDTLDSDTPDATFTYTRLGRQNVVTQSGIATWTFDYDDGETGEGNTLRLVSEAIAGTGGFYSKTITRDYEGSGTGQVPGRDAGFHIGSDYEVNYYYDNAGSGGQLTGTGRFKRITGPGLPTYGVQYSYTANSDLLSISKFKTGSDDSTTVAAVSRGYESSRDLLTSVTNWASGVLGTFSTYTYAYDELGRRKSVVNGGTQFSPAELNKWGYNPKSELVWSYRHEGSNPDEPGTEITAERRLYTYDQIGNRQDTTVGNYSTPTLRYCADDLNRYNQTYTGNQQTCPVASPAESFAYDEDGNLTQDGMFNYTWDAENRLIEVVTRIEAGQNPSAYESGDKHVYFTYDYMGRRIRKRVETYNGSSWPETSDELFVYDGWNIVMVINANASDVNATAAITRKYTWGLDLSGTIHGAGGIGGLLAAFIPAGEPDDVTLWYFYDANGNVGQVLDTTSLQTIGIGARYEYDPYGNPIPIPQPPGPGPYADLNPFRFSTKWFDPETGLGNWGHRYYSPRLGRWISRDPIEEQGGLNLYSCCRNSPVIVVDPIGLWLTPDTVWDIGSIVWDVGKITIGVVTSNPVLIAEGKIDLTCDAISLALPGVPAGASKAIRIVRRGSAAAKAAKVARNADEVVVVYDKMRRVDNVTSLMAKKGAGLTDGMVDYALAMGVDSVGTNVKITIKGCGETITAEIDLLIEYGAKKEVFELKNWSSIGASEARTIIDQMTRQTEVIGRYFGDAARHGGLIVGDATQFTKEGIDVFKTSGYDVYRYVKGELKVVIQEGKIVDPY